MKNPMVGGQEMYPTKNIHRKRRQLGRSHNLGSRSQGRWPVDTLSGTGPFTVFAPTNEAFAKLPAGTVDTLLKPENKVLLTKVLTYHVVAGRVSSRSLCLLIIFSAGCD